VNVGGYGGPDRFYAQNSAGGSFSQNQNTLSAVNKNSILHQVLSVPTSFTGTNLWSGIRQPIEGLNCYDLWQKPIAVSFNFVAKVTGNYSFSLSDSAFAYSFVTTFNYAVADAIQSITVLVPACPSGMTIPRTTGAGLHVQIGAINKGTYQTAPSSSVWKTGTYVSATGAVDWSASTANYICATEIQLEAGSVATPFERLPYGQVLALCQRYYEKIGGEAQYDILIQGYGGTGAPFSIMVPFKVQKRASPTVTKFGTWAVSNCSQPGVIGTGSTTTAALNSNVTTAGPASFNTIDSSTYLAASAEL
jgi:hypothetical protein